jgi:hypothetical protein
MPPNLESHTTGRQDDQREQRDLSSGLSVAHPKQQCGCNECDHVTDHHQQQRKECRLAHGRQNPPVYPQLALGLSIAASLI